LPSAIILYAPKSIQRMSREEHRLGLMHTYFGRKIELKNYVSYQNDYLNYVDSSYLNSQGYLESNYSSENAAIGSTITYYIDSNWSIFTSNEIAVQRLKTLNYTVTPTRLTQASVVGVNGSLKSIDLQLFVGNTNYTSLDSLQRTNWKNQMIGFFGLSKTIKGSLSIRPNIFYKSSFRLPSFNELFYQQIGNLNLKPELSNQVNAQINVAKSHKKWSIFCVMDVFYNVIENRILAIPTKNLFQWSIQNIGRSQGYGFESKIDFTRTVNFHRFEVEGTYSFQKITDKSNVSAPTFNNILPYQPLHSVNASFSYSYKKVGMTMNYNFVGARYSLTQNIPSNEILYFNLVDLAIWSKFTVVRNTFKCMFNIKNLTNTSYAYVKNYFMPGINYQLTLVYGFK
jgi:vitamin B12 transporter